ncbi:thioredoxin family protein [Georgenia satyanarayanai]|uniref:thioredoxin family protein n=1 Tax=Georgenia satyanarayanai TaxID=860221 RepID=UPI00203CC95D|nr:thioredoxin family protein [Georgenia satyanarayanai]MCM3661570.1 thioredoxin family protein [Georgenia satyanarayanai]
MTSSSLTADALGLSGPLGERATLLQISSGFCAPCRAARGLLARVAETTPGVRHLDIDVAHDTDLAARLEITQTPTVVVLDAGGTVVTRYEGVPRLAAVRELLDRLAPAGA